MKHGCSSEVLQAAANASRELDANPYPGSPAHTSRSQALAHHPLAPCQEEGRSEFGACLLTGRHPVMDKISPQLTLTPHQIHNRQMWADRNASLESAIGDAIYEFAQKTVNAYLAAKKQAEIDRVVKALFDTIA
jgi:hypothetical protein